MTAIRAVGDIVLRWGESLRWDDRRARLYFVDCTARKLCWLDHGGDGSNQIQLDAMPTGLALCESGHVLTVLDDGVYLIDPDDRNLKQFAQNPEANPRLNDAQADRDGNLITGSLSLDETAEGSFWWLSHDGAWKRLDRDISNTNGPVVAADGGTLLIADTSARAIYRYAYDPENGTVGRRELLASTATLGGRPDGAVLDRDGNYWSTVLSAGKLACFDPAGALIRQIELPVEYPTSVAFGGPDLDRLYVTSISDTFRHIQPSTPLAGALLELSGIDTRGTPEPRFKA